MLTLTGIEQLVIKNAKDMRLALNNKEYFRLFELKALQDNLYITWVELLNRELIIVRGAA